MLRVPDAGRSQEAQNKDRGDSERTTDVYASLLDRVIKSARLATLPSFNNEWIFDPSSPLSSEIALLGSVYPTRLVEWKYKIGAAENLFVRFITRLN